MMNHFFSLYAFTGMLFLSSCAGNKLVEVEEQEEIQPDRMVARVSSVNEAAEYVLIQRFGRLVIPEDSILYTLDSSMGGSNTTASIKLTGEKLGQFLAADIISGELIVGDAVYLRTFEKMGATDSQETLIN
ncbi:MAG: hypothetical protein ACSHX6_12710 [Akkermansiaceae bacterium]